jgi:hypothetical protein
VQLERPISSGFAAASSPHISVRTLCKAVYTGSIPVVASLQITRFPIGSPNGAKAVYSAEFEAVQRQSALGSERASRVQAMRAGDDASVVMPSGVDFVGPRPGRARASLPHWVIEAANGAPSRQRVYASGRILSEQWVAKSSAYFRVVLGIRSGVSRENPKTVPGKSSSRWISQILSCSLGGSTWAGSPTATQPIGTSPSLGQDRVDVHDAPDPDFGSRAEPSAGEQGGACGDERLVGDRGPVDMRVRPDDDVPTDSSRVSAATADQRVLHHDHVVSELDRPAVVC